MFYVSEFRSPSKVYRFYTKKVTSHQDQQHPTIRLSTSEGSKLFLLSHSLTSLLSFEAPKIGFGKWLQRDKRASHCALFQPLSLSSLLFHLSSDLGIGDFLHYLQCVQIPFKASSHAWVLSFALFIACHQFYWNHVKYFRKFVTFTFSLSISLKRSPSI